MIDSYSEAKSALQIQIESSGTVTTHQAWASMGREIVNEWVDRCRKIGVEAAVDEMNAMYAEEVEA